MTTPIHAEPPSHTPPAPREASAGGLRLPVATWAAVWCSTWVATAAFGSLAVRGHLNALHLALALFLAINAMICVWEICLLLRIGAIEERYANRGAHAGGRRRSRSIFLTPVRFGELLSADLWSRVWSEYAVYDPSYADRRSFGFAIDVGNGVTTLLPNLVFFAAMTLPLLPANVVGIIGGLFFYQKFYGTCLYFFTYCFNRRYRGHRLANVVAIVGGTNGVWLIFPAIGLYACARLVLENDFAVIWG